MRDRVDTSGHPKGKANPEEEKVQGLIIGKTPATRLPSRIRGGHKYKTCLLFVEVMDLRTLPDYLDVIRDMGFVYINLGFVHIPSGRLWLEAKTPDFKPTVHIKDRGVA